MPIYLMAPADCSSASIGSLQVIPDEKGLAEIPDGVDCSPLLDHGFTPCTEQDLAAIWSAQQRPPFLKNAQRCSDFKITGALDGHAATDVAKSAGLIEYYAQLSKYLSWR